MNVGPGIFFPGPSIKKGRDKIDEKSDSLFGDVICFDIAGGKPGGK
jgi:hypothetical protein